MFDIGSFSKCIRDNLKERKFGKERADEIIKEFETRAKNHQANGKTESEAGFHAAREVFDNMSIERAERVRRTSASLAAQADGIKRIREGVDEINVNVWGKDAKARGSRGAAAVVAIKAMMSPDVRAKGNNVFTLSETMMKTAMAVWDNETGKLDNILVGKFGVQKGKAHMDNLIFEAYGKKTGDDSASELAAGWRKANSFQIQEFRAAGGSIRELENYIPQPRLNAAKMAKNPDAFIQDYVNSIDWNRTRRPDGTPVAVKDREEFARQAYMTQAYDGANKIDLMQQRGSGRAKGNKLDQNRVVHIKDPESWLNLQKKYGDGSVYDVLHSHMADLAHTTAMVKVFGPNPDMMVKSLAEAAKGILTNEKKVSPRELAKFDGKIKEINDLYTVVARKNPLNPESRKAHVFLTAQNLTTAAFLQGSSIVSAVTDPIITGFQKAVSGSSFQSGMGLYARAAATDTKNMRQVMLRSGFIYDSSINHQYATQRFEQNMNAGQHVSRRVADVTLRANGMTHLTNAAQVRTVGERMAFMAETLDTPYDKHKLKDLFKRYGISEADWDSVRRLTPRDVGGGVKFLEPIDLMRRGQAGDRDLFYKMQHMLIEDSRMGVVMSTPEAAVTLRGASRPDTWSGLILASWSMFKSFPLQYMNNILRYTMTIDSQAGRASYLAGSLAATTLAGYFALQLREMSQGRTLASFTDEDGSFNETVLVKSMMKGGGLGFLGDVVFGLAEEGGASVENFLAGPPSALLADASLAFVINPATLGYQWIEGEITEDEFYEKWSTGLVKTARKYTPGQRLPYTEQLLSHMFWNKLERAVDPQWDSKIRRRVGNTKELYGNKYYWDPREPAPDFSQFREE